MKFQSSEIENSVQAINFKQDGLLLVRIGSDSRPATTADIADFSKQLDKFLGKKYPDLLVLVTHHNVDMQFIYPGKNSSKVRRRL